jgi:hypothetical protein
MRKHPGGSVQDMAMSATFPTRGFAPQPAIPQLGNGRWTTLEILTSGDGAIFPILRRGSF